MADQSPPNTYKQGYSASTVSNHQRRTAEVDAAFLLPHIKKTDRILDVGCGPGTITSGFAKYAPEGMVVGIDISADVLEKARALAAEAGVPAEGPGSVVFEQGNVLGRLPHPDDTFDIVFCSQVLGHMPSPDLVVRALTEMRRVLRPGGILAAREAAFQHFWPRHLGLDRLWVANLRRALRGSANGGGGGGDDESIGASLPSLFRRAGFDPDSGKVVVGAGTSVIFGPEARRWIARRATGQLQPGDPFRQSWVDAGITEDEIQETLRAIAAWAETEDAVFMALQCEMLAWK
ncbi:uncharacterized protein THITE_2057225 [Thermothielavioides terrestris NRRL 8126]|uniref:Methyltransferase domain-containing protein n=1 Tax=Thermothielavioides terrestris (strain ATCC 38088 / NRRL 8126) TaxID=578455 RepID=G2RD19_THETT|nr:uncharacterized protein THITE_2057225 [Thermothielavioides terrestris NRRL 8126]AEO70712.1 hypothetical protein THITE_2057225 [Thermothielavioides terrestris NRRL 8126]